jgi:hypothetical protein
VHMGSDMRSFAVELAVYMLDSDMYRVAGALVARTWGDMWDLTVAAVSHRSVVLLVNPAVAVCVG